MADFHLIATTLGSSSLPISSQLACVNLVLNSSFVCRLYLCSNVVFCIACIHVCHRFCTCENAAYKHIHQAKLSLILSLALLDRFVLYFYGFLNWLFVL